MPEQPTQTKYTPKQFPKKIKLSRNVLFYMNWLRAGWSIRGLAIQSKMMGDNISRESFRRFYHLIPSSNEFFKTPINWRFKRDFSKKRTTSR